MTVCIDHIFACRQPGTVFIAEFFRHIIHIHQILLMQCGREVEKVRDVMSFACFDLCSQNGGHTA